MPHSPRAARPLTPLMTPLVIAAGAAALLLTGCAGDPATTAADTPAADTPAASEPPAAPTEASTPPSAEPMDDLGGGDGNDVCALLTDAEVASVVGAATVDTTLTFGSLADSMGGQCVWSATGSGAYLELAAWPADGLNPPPAEAPAPGSDAFVPVTGGAYFADATHAFRLAVTGTADPALGAAAQTLAQQVKARG